MKLGLVTDCLAGKTLEEAAQICESLELEQVELGCGNWSPAPHIDLDALVADGGKRRKLTDTLAAHGLSISALNCSGNPLFPSEKGRRDRAVVEKTFTLAEQLGLRTVVMMSGLPGGCPGDAMPNWVVSSWPPETQEILNYQWSVAIPAWEKITALAKSHGVERLALEFHGWQLVYNVETFLRLREAVGATVGVNLDPSHLFWMGADPLVIAKELAGCIYHAHIKDVRIEPAAGTNTLLDTKGVLEFAARSWNYVTPGSGHGEGWWRQFVTALREAGYDGALSIEQEDCTIPAMDALRRGAALMRQAMK